MQGTGGGRDPGRTRYGCFLPDLTGLARDPSAADLPLPLWTTGRRMASGARAGLDAPAARRHVPRMNGTAFDTLAAARELEAAGLARDRAAAIVGVVRRADAADRETLATKADIANMATKADLAGLEARLTRRLVMLGAAIGGMLAAAAAMLEFL